MCAYKYNQIIQTQTKNKEPQKNKSNKLNGPFLLLYYTKCSKKKDADINLHRTAYVQCDNTKYNLKYDRKVGIFL